jgi:hypothetical protein
MLYLVMMKSPVRKQTQDFEWTAIRWHKLGKKVKEIVTKVCAQIHLNSF